MRVGNVMDAERCLHTAETKEGTYRDFRDDNELKVRHEMKQITNQYVKLS
jgi:hypothetical protein